VGVRTHLPIGMPRYVFCYHYLSATAMEHPIEAGDFDVKNGAILALMSPLLQIAWTARSRMYNVSE